MKVTFFKHFCFLFSLISEINQINSGDKLKCIIFDLGYSLNQIKDNTKGLSFNSTGKLNMSMGLNTFSAHDVIHNLDLSPMICAHQCNA